MRLIFLLLLALPGLTFGQSNYNLENFGNKSILLSGNVTGSVDDLGLTYYNPARIALVENPVFSINAKGYQLNQYTVKNAFGLEQRLNSSNFQGVPSMVAGTFSVKKLKNHHFAYSFLSRTRTSVDLNYLNELSYDTNSNNNYERFVSDVNLKNRTTDEWFGLTWGKLLKENLSIGVSTFFSVYSSGASNNLRYAGLATNEQVDLYNNEVSYSQKSYGMFFKIGLAYKLPKIELGINIDLPYWEIVSNGRFTYQDYLSVTDSTNDIFEFYKYDDLEATRKEPLGISVGAGIPLKRSKLHLKLDWHNSVPIYDRLTIPNELDPITGETRFQFTEERRAVLNFGLGAEFYISDTYKAFGSFSTDFSAIDKNTNIFDVDYESSKGIDLNANFFHLASGVDLKLKWGHIVLGVTYSTGNSGFSHRESVISPEPDYPNSSQAEIDYTRWRFIVGLDIPIFNYKLEVK